jgi:hypothetical protein
MKIKEQEPDGFPEFWAAWRPFMRKNDGRGEARTTYRKHILAGAEPADIIDGAKAYLRSLTERDKPYIPLAATWLNRCAYEDWAEQERDYRKRLAEKAANVVPMPVSRSKFSLEWDRRQAAKQAAE